MKVYPSDAPRIPIVLGTPAVTTARPSQRAHQVADAQPSVRIVPVTVAGVARFITVGETEFGLPAGYRSAHAEHEPIAYLYSPQGRVHVLCPSGEVTGFSVEVLESIRAKYFST
jgi:hypothetical protein